MDYTAITEFFNYVDADKDGFITIDEIKDACKVDINGDGTITDDEKLQTARVWIVEKLPIQDLNGDQKLTLDELVAYNNDATNTTAN